MISSIEWVPAGVADPKPKKYEFSTAEIELIKMMEEQKIDIIIASPEDSNDAFIRIALETGVQLWQIRSTYLSC